MKKWFLIVLLFFLLVRPAGADNKFGIHILETGEVDKASQLVNSSGGDWGWVTIVLREDDLQKDKWQKFMDDCREKHLIPIVRLATHMENNFWAKPTEDKLGRWVDFLSELNWPVKDQLVIAFNEPNHASEWGGEIKPAEYSQLLDKLIVLFKQKNPNFQVLNAGLDQAADGQKGTMREENFLAEMAVAVPEIFAKLDGWASHSYPNHGFVGQPTDTGRATIRGYEWELEEIARVSRESGVPQVPQVAQVARATQEWKVFITETGWPHREGGAGGYYDAEKTSQFLLQAYEIWDQDEQVKTVTPFVLNYPAQPFASFSWLKEDGSGYAQYDKVLGVSKTANQPEQLENFQVVHLDLPEILPINHTVKAQIRIRNTGQWIIGERAKFVVPVQGEVKVTEAAVEQGQRFFPGEERTLEFKLTTSTQSGEKKIIIADLEKTLYTYKPFELKNRKVGILRQIWTSIKLAISN